MSLISTLQNHLRGLDHQTYAILRQVGHMVKDLYNSALYIQRQRFFSTGNIYSQSTLFKQVKTSSQYLCLSSDLAQQTLIKVNQNFSSFFKLLKKKKNGKYKPKIRLPHYLKKDGFYLFSFISRQFRASCPDCGDDCIRLSLGLRGKASTGKRYIHIPAPTEVCYLEELQPRSIRILPRYDARYFEIDYIYDIEPYQRSKPAIPDSYLSIDLGLDNFATCITTNETAFIIDGRAIKSYNRWWNKYKSKYQSRINKQGIVGMTRRMARLQQKRRYVIDNYLNHVVNYIIQHCLDNQIETIVVGEWGDMKRNLKMRKKVGQLFQTLPYGRLKQKLRYKADVNQIQIEFPEESYTSQDCFNCGIRRKANRVRRGLYQCIKCGIEMNADINGACNIMKKVAPKRVINQLVDSLRGSSGGITPPSRIQLADFV